MENLASPLKSRFASLSGITCTPLTHGLGLQLGALKEREAGTVISDSAQVPAS